MGALGAYRKSTNTKANPLPMRNYQRRGAYDCAVVNNSRFSVAAARLAALQAAYPAARFTLRQNRFDYTVLAEVPAIEDTDATDALIDAYRTVAVRACPSGAEDQA